MCTFVPYFHILETLFRAVEAGQQETVHVPDVTGPHSPHTRTTEVAYLHTVWQVLGPDTSVIVEIIVI